MLREWIAGLKETVGIGLAIFFYGAVFLIAFIVIDSFKSPFLH